MKNPRKEYSGQEIYELANKSIALLKVEGGHGSGVVISKDGLILTNYHCYSDKLKILIGKEVFTKYKVVNAYIDVDLILIKVNAKNLVPLKLADSSKLKVGSVVYAIGTPLDTKLLNTISNGIISGIRLKDGSYFIQTNAIIYGGNSGGALINSSGELIGITSKVYLQSVDKNIVASGLSFAVHLKFLKKLVEDKDNIINNYNRYLYDGIIQSKRDDYDLAMISFNKYLMHFPKDSYGYLERGKLYERNGYITEAMADYKKCIKHDSKKPYFSHVAYAGLYRYEKNRKRKLEYLKKAIRLDPKNPDYMLCRADEYIYDNKPKKAIIVLFELLLLMPQSPEINYKLGELFFKNNSIQSAINHYELAAKYSNNDSYYFEVASLLYNNNYKSENEIYTKILDLLYLAINLNYKNSDVYFLISKCLVDLHDYSSAYRYILFASYYNEKLKLYFPEYHYYMGIVTKNIFKDNTHVKHFGKALELIKNRLPYQNPLTEEQKIENNYKLELQAEIHFESGNYGEALIEFEKVLREASRDTYPNRIKYLTNKITSLTKILELS